MSVNRHRDAVLWKTTPAGSTLLDLVTHLAAGGYGWLRTTFGAQTGPLPFGLLACSGRVLAAADQAITGRGLGVPGTAWLDDPVPARWALVRLIEDVARLVDGAADDQPES